MENEEIFKVRYGGFSRYNYKKKDNLGIEFYLGSKNIDTKYCRVNDICRNWMNACTCTFINFAHIKC